jgi:glycosyltransferase involved in cell wall biosynthesis
LNQRFQDFELIVVDDGSTDGTREVLGAYGARLRYIYQENRGPSAARNLGVRNARGAWIAIQDSDDLCAPEHLAALYGYVQSHPECGMVFGNGAYLGGKEHNRETIIAVDKSRRLARQGVRLVDQFDKSIMRLQASLIAKSAYDALGGMDESLRICHDLDLFFRLWMRCNVAYLDRVVFYYRRHQGNISRDDEVRQVENIRIIKKFVEDFPRARGMLGPKKVSMRLAYRYYRLAKTRWRKRQFAAARDALVEAVALRPWSLKYRLYQLVWGLSPSR